MRLQSHFTLLVAALVMSVAARADTLEEYAAKCDQASGFTIPDFDCDAGTEVPMTNYDASAQTCDRPNRLNSECDPGSRFQVLHRAGTNRYAVAHCRKENQGPGKYGDIAVIQSTPSGTCFYQALQSGLDGKVKAPSKGTDAYPWKTPAETAGIKCGECHDNGPIIRSPYLAQLSSGPNALPGAGDDTFNRLQHYSFIGDDFAWWKVYKVEIENNRCNHCHRMGVNNVGSGGTARDFGLRATGQSETHKNPHGPDSPIWMVPGQIHYEPGTENAAQAIAACANRVGETPLPNGPDCRITDYTGKPPAFKRTPDQRHSGNFVETSELVNELVIVQDKKLVHYHNDDAFQTGWSKLLEFYSGHPHTAGNKGFTPPVPLSVSLIQSNYGSPRNLEIVARLRPVQHAGPQGTEDYLAHFWYDSSAGKWNGPFPITVDGQRISGVTSAPVLIQSNYGATGDFELLVAHGPTIVHYRRDNDAVGLPWRKVADVYTASSHSFGRTRATRPALPVGLAVAQTNFGDPNQLDLVARLVARHGPISSDAPGELVHFQFDRFRQSWSAPARIVADGTPISNATGDPALLQSTFGAKGNFELAVPQGNQMAHYYRDNDAAGTPWHRAGDMFNSVPQNAPGGALRLLPIPVGTTMLQDSSTNYLQSLVHMTSRLPGFLDPDYLAFFYFNITDGKWSGPYPLIIGGKQVNISGL